MPYIPGFELQPDDLPSLKQNFPYRPTLFLGLGGTGAQAIAKIKRLFLDLYAPEVRQDTDAVVAGIPPMYRFLAFDSARGDRPAELADQREWFHLGITDLAAFYQEAKKRDFYKSWLTSSFSTGSILSGCQGQRGLGRFALMHNLGEVHRQIAAAHQEIRRADPRIRNPKPIVYLCSSLSGGTGGGTFLDVAFLLRAIDPDAEVVGIISVIDGMEGLSDLAKETMQVGTYCALKELNAFMAPPPSDVPYDQDIAYPMGVRGVCREPFDQCYLISNYRNDGTSSLSSHSAFSSFSARVIFSLCAYSFDSKKSPDVAGVLNNHLQHLRTFDGYKAKFLVPGFAQIHFPLKDASRLFAIQAATRYLKHQCGGKGTDGSEQALAFMVQQGCQAVELKGRVSIPKGTRKALIARTYDETVSEMFKAPYDQAEAILGLGKSMPSGRAQEIRKILQESAKAVVEEFTQKADAEIRQRMVEPGSLGVGTIDFLDDLCVHLAHEHARVADSIQKRLTPDYEAIGRDWRAMESTIKDAVTDEGFFDRKGDSLKRSGVINMLAAFLNDAEQKILDRTIHDLLQETLADMLQRCRERHQAVTDLFHRDLPAVRALFEESYTQLITHLENQAYGKADDVMGICSINVMSENWLKGFFDRQVDLKPEQAIATLLARDWHPARLLDTPPKGNLSRVETLAGQIFELFRPLAQKVEDLAPLDILSANLGTQDITETISRVFFSQLQPQMQIAGMRTYVQRDPDHLLFCGGVSESMQLAWKNVPELQRMPPNVARNMEANRINFLQISLPVALVGCTMLKNRLEPAYRRWESRLPAGNTKEARTHREDEIRLAHCFPGSYYWPLPTEVSSRGHEDKQLFAKALAISEIFEVSQEDQKVMKLSTTSKEFRYGLFQIGAAQFWLWPFFEPMGGTPTIKGSIARLGSNIATAMEALGKNEAHRANVKDWVIWFEHNWNNHFSFVELNKRRDYAIAAFQARKAKVNDPELVHLWDELINAVLDWEL